MIRALVVEDEPVARQGLVRALLEEPDLEVVGEAVDGPTGVDLIRLRRPDLLFLDVQIPGFDGFELIARIRDHFLPVVIFVSAFDRYAIRAFDVHALDYLLKPFTPSRLHEAVEHARGRLAEPDADASRRLGEMLAERSGERPRAWLDRFAVRERGATRFIPARDVECIQSAGNYAELVTGAGTHLIRMTMRQIEDALDPRCFARIHRTAIINLDRLRVIRPTVNSDFDVELTSGRVLRLSRRFRSRLPR